MDALQVAIMRRLAFKTVNPLMEFRKRKYDRIDLQFDSPNLFFDVTAEKHRIQFQRLTEPYDRETYWLRITSFIDGHEAEVFTRNWSVRLYKASEDADPERPSTIHH